MPMKIQVHKNSNNIYLVELSGAMDLYSSNQLKELLMKMIKNRVERFIINLNEVSSVTSSGIGALIYVSSTLKKLNCPLIIVAPGGPVMNALEVTRLASYFTIVPSLKEALSPKKGETPKAAALKPAAPKAGVSKPAAPKGGPKKKT